MIENAVVKIPKVVSTELNELEENTCAQSYKLLKEHLPLITCVCGAEILLVPDLDAMNLAINAHVAQHRKNRTVAQGKGKCFWEHQPTAKPTCANETN